ncbi:MAG TPA: FtsX-like permease family protein [Vicinamibacterales bacterium]|nr:FtsX-like permease family protein [Vicinamibacterales bacterium]
MQLRDIAWASLRRRPGRATFTVAVVAISVGTAIALLLLSRVMQAEVADELDRFGANIIITPKSQSIDLAYGGIAVAGLTVDVQQLRSADADAVWTIPARKNINAVAPRLVGASEVDGHRVVLIGVHQKEEAKVKSWWQADGRLARSSDEIMLGAEAARLLERRPGDTLELAGAPRRISAVLHATGTIDDAAVFADLESVQRALRKPGEVNMIEVSALCSGCPIEHIVYEISTALPHARVAPIRQAVAARERAVRQFTQFSYALSAVVLLVGTLVVAATLMASVVERTQEIGILRAVGYRKAQVGRIVVTEAVWITAAGGLFGWIAGLAAVRLLAPVMAESAVPGAPDPVLGIVAVAGAIVLGVTAAGYPAVRAARMEPSSALRHL